MMATDIEELRRKAEAGSCVAQSILGAYYLCGNEVEVDYIEAFRLLSAAAQQGSSRAVLNLGRMYAQGLGTSQDVFEVVPSPFMSSVSKMASSFNSAATRLESLWSYVAFQVIQPGSPKMTGAAALH
jgi:TPR repeat protein